MTTFFAILAVGFFLGMRHAADPDHVIAVTTIVTRSKKVGSAALVGALWGIGHTLTIVAVGAFIIMFSVVVPPRIGLTMELAVGIMLVFLGIMNLAGMRAQVSETLAQAASVGHDDVHSHVHAHGDYVHTHVHGHSLASHSHSAERTPVAILDRWLKGVAGYRWLRPLLVGIVHGLAGSAAVALLVLATIPSPRWAVAYLLIFGVGTIAGMMLITVAIASGLAWAGARSAWWARRMALVSGVISVAFGLVIAYQIGWVQGLFTANPHWTPR
jgi:ABC-type transport system involved in multi-copper enzyme maturation permease subunit